MAASDDLKIAWQQVSAKQAYQKRCFDYYDGDQPLAYTTKRLRDIFKSFQMQFSANWCAVVIDAVLDRLELLGMAEDEAVMEQFRPWWDAANVETEARLIHEYALLTGEAFATIWPNETTHLPELYANDPRVCHVQYDGENPRTQLWAAKFWTANDGKYRATLYYPDRLEYWETNKKREDVTEVKAFTLENEETNPFDQIPIFHWRIHARRMKSDLDPVRPLQDAINKLLADMMVAAEYGAFKQRYTIGEAATKGLIKNAPNEIWDLPEGMTVGEFSATELVNYLGAIENLVAQVGSITRTPRHFFLATSGQASGDALLAQEAPLVAKVEDRQQAFGPTWRAAFQFAAELMGADRDEIMPQWGPAAVIPPLTRATILQTYRNSGLPLPAALRAVGYDQQEIQTILDEQKVEEQARRSSLGEQIAQSQVDFDRGGADDES